eukprot:CAMPEP_0173449808 /NCGR_PEP_ID=MMETSP1357-20121228/43454_1 /TAXON_ID=77926 /ORGANISM="Hemiselmis rufescens, Strain PCC563" /LENGTH=236 /DNA_ID=CAMNT_0014416423 /DNA_START=30 /DNA_END=736 /DNA_ORIENTATION=+
MKVAWAHWRPRLVLEQAVRPTQVEPLKGLSKRHGAIALHGAPPRPIVAVDLAPRGRSYHLVVADADSRMSMHMRNGSIIASAQLPGADGDGGPRCAVSQKTVCAFCTSQGMVFYETKERRLLSQTCSRIIHSDEGLPDYKPPPPPKGGAANATGNETVAKKRTRFPPQPVKTPIVSFAYDNSLENQAYAGTGDGKMLVLQVRGEKNRVRCTLNNEVIVSADREHPNVMVVATKGFA